MHTQLGTRSSAHTGHTQWHMHFFTAKLNVGSCAHSTEAKRQSNCLNAYQLSKQTLIPHEVDIQGCLQICGDLLTYTNSNRVGFLALILKLPCPRPCHGFVVLLLVARSHNIGSTRPITIPSTYRKMSFFFYVSFCMQPYAGKCGENNQDWAPPKRLTSASCRNSSNKTSRNVKVFFA